MGKYIHCDACNTDNDASNSVCWYCGNKLDNDNAYDEEEKETIVLHRNRNTPLLSGIPMLLLGFLVFDLCNGFIAAFILLVAMFITNTAINIFLMVVSAIIAILATIFSISLMMAGFRRIHKSNGQFNEVLCAKGGKLFAYDINGRMYSDVRMHRLTFSNKFVFYKPSPGSNRLVCLGCHVADDLPKLKPLIKEQIR